MAKKIPIVDTRDLINLNKVQPIEPEPAVALAANSRDIAMMRSMMQYARPRPQANLSPVVIQPVTRKTKISLVLLPKWAIFFAPYGLARITGILRAAGYSTRTHDFNVETYHRFKTIFPEDQNPYNGHGASDFLWLEGMYERRVWPYLEPLLEEYLQTILDPQPDIVGFSMYYTNVLPTRWMVQRIKQLSPKTIVIAGGSQMQWVKCIDDPYPELDYMVQGEAEQLILDLLQQIEDGTRPTQKLLVADKQRRIDLDQLPFPDYSDMDLDLYTMPNAISSELSRGCVAKCAYCPETLFWKYRSRQALPILDEVEHQCRTYGTDVYWFLDSLVNGNINELRAFALGVVERGLKIKWQGYARCDTRMDQEYLADLARSGCVRLDYGIESGSQPVLDAMRKNVKVETIEQNMRDGAQVGIKHFTQWMTCFANERPNDIARTMTLAWRIQAWNLDDMARGTMGLGLNEIDDNKDKYGIDHRCLFGHWTTRDFDLTKIHRLIRYKTFNMFIEQMPVYAPKDHSRIWGLGDSYAVRYDSPVDLTNVGAYLEMPYEDFDYQIISAPELDWTFSRTVVNEVWPFVRTLWRSRAGTGMSLTITFDPHWDMEHFGDRLAGDLSAKYEFDIDSRGHWQAKCRFKFNTPAGNVFGPYWSARAEERTNFDIDLDWCGQGHWTYQPPAL